MSLEILEGLRMSFEEKVVPLEGITILDMSAVLSGPASTMLLADQGARVIKVESSEGDITRKMGVRKGSLSTAFININRGKQSLSIDLKTLEGRQIIEGLVQNSDVFVQNFRPGVIERLGLDEKSIRKLNHQVVYVSISGFGNTGPLKNSRVYDPVIQAISGFADIQAGGSSRPKMVRTVIPDKVTALKAAQAITAGLFYRSRVTKGCHIKLSMLDAMVAFLWPEGMMNYTLIEERASGGPEGQIAQDLVFRTLDGFITVGAMSDQEWASLCEVLQKPEWVS
ncbi:CoA transferase, partial [Pseudomonadota bacterium]|nr:CoA transferase [Pseudomonadota bacterium]